MNRTAQIAAWADIVTAIRKLNESGASYESIAKRIGAGTSTVHGIANGRNKGLRTGYDKMIDYASRLGIDIEHHFVDSGLEASDCDFSYVSHVRAKLGAGASLVTSNQEIERLAFTKSFLARENINPKKAVIFDVVGDSMEPLIPEGSMVLVSIKEEDMRPRSGQIVASRIRDEIMIKRFINMGETILLQSENKDRPDHTVFPEAEDWSIIGVVRWCSFVLR